MDFSNNDSDDEGEGKEPIIRTSSLPEGDARILRPIQDEVNAFKPKNENVRRPQGNKSIHVSQSANGISSLHERKEGFTKISSIASISLWWKNYIKDKRDTKRKKKEEAEEVRMRYKLQYHFMTPFQKYKLGRRPWKLAVQILKIFIVTTQVILFGTDRFASVAFIKHTEKTLRHILIYNYDGSETFSYYSRNDLVEAIKHAHEKYYVIGDIAIGQFWYTNNSSSENASPIRFCKEIYKEGSFGRVNDYESATSTRISFILDCDILTNDTSKFDQILRNKNYFDRIRSFQLKFQLQAIYINGLKLRHKPECYLLYNTINIDNEKHDGRLRVSFHMREDILSSCPKGNWKISHDAKIIKQLFIAFDLLVITICLLSLILCVRSVIKSIMLAKAAQRYFIEYRHELLTKWDLFELINKWFGVIVISDLMSVIGSIYKIRVDERNIRYYNICSVLLGLGAVAVWIGLLRFLTYLEKYNILLITIRSAAPNLIRFMFCAMFIFFGFTFCGWIVLGPYHKKFQTFLTTAECLFSLLNGDDMYPTFAHMSQRSTPIWVFSKIYIYTFVSLFIYVVLSTFISIVGDTYERLKDFGRMPPSRIELFILGNKVTERRKTNPTQCQRCAREENSAGIFDNDLQNDDNSLRRSSLTSSQLSIVSASWE